jgi:hypothetical protein
MAAKLALHLERTIPFGSAVLTRMVDAAFEPCAAPVDSIVGELAVTIRTA